MTVYPNPKLNLGLEILRKRPDGYHDLETLFIPCDAFKDELTIEKADEFTIEIEGCDWDPQNDLTAKAWRLMRDSYGIGPVSIRMKKGIPVGAGLGGGSADAAFALICLSEIFGLGLSDDELAGLAAKLGSDCAFFIYNRPMFGSGRGEILEDFPIDLSGYQIRVDIPEGVHVSTREAYSGIVPRDTAAGRVSAPSGFGSRKGRGPTEWGGSLGAETLSAALRRPVEEWKECVVNDFEKSVFALYPQISALKERFYSEGAVYAAMSGSGSSVFGLFRK